MYNIWPNWFSLEQTITFEKHCPLIHTAVFSYDPKKKKSNVFPPSHPLARAGTAYGSFRFFFFAFFWITLWRLTQSMREIDHHSTAPSISWHTFAGHIMIGCNSSIEWILLYFMCRSVVAVFGHSTTKTIFVSFFFFSSKFYNSILCDTRGR